MRRLRTVNDVRRNPKVTLIVEQRELQGLIQAKMRKYAMLMKVISIYFNKSNKIFKYQKSYLKSADKFRPPLLSIVRSRGGEMKKPKIKSATEGQVNPVDLNT